MSKRIEHRPVRHRVGSRRASPRSRDWAGDRARIQMIAADDDGGFQLAARRHHVVEHHAGAVAVAEPDPADARRQALERDALARHVEPAMQVPVLGEQPLHRRVGLVDVFRIAGRRRVRPSGTAPRRGRTAGGYRRARSPGNRTRLRRPHPGDLADVVAVVEGRDALLGEVQHRAHMPGDGFARRRRDRFRIGDALGLPLGERPAFGKITVAGIVRAGLVGNGIGPHAAPHELRQYLGRVAKETTEIGVFDSRTSFNASSRSVTPLSR